MPRYFFNTTDGQPCADEEGVELAGLTEARRECACLAGQLLRDDPDEFWASETLSVIVTDERGMTLFTVLIAGVTSPAISRPAGRGDAGPERTRP